MLTSERLREVLHYDPETGVFTGARRRGKSLPGSVVGGPNKDGYLRISVDEKLYSAHRLAWLYVYGEFPEHDIDHIDGIRNNNRILNLREVTRSENQQNIYNAYKNSKTGFLGVSQRGNRFQAQIKINGKRMYLGSFSSPEEAHIAYIEAKREFHPKSNL